MEPEKRKLTPVRYRRILKQIYTHTEIHVCLVFIPRKRALESNTWTLAKTQKVSPN